MTETIDLLIKYFQGYQWLILFAVVYAYSIFKAKKGGRISILVGTVLFFVFIYNDFIYEWMSQLVESGVYYRFLWIIPVTIWIAYGLVMIFLDLEKWWLRIPFVLAALACMFLMDHTWLEPDRGTWSRPENVSLIPGEVLDISDVLTDEHPYGEKIRCVLPLGMSMQLRCVDASVECVIPRRDYLKMNGQSTRPYKQKELAFMIEKNERPDVSRLKKLLDDTETDVIVAYSDYSQGDYLRQADCELIKKTGAYEVYRVK
ncbi:MAG: hypothetical protein K6B14_04725 [Lachnospiraceae bacterium]|nr:hypothetical protein [Lachnospiraceae bacterium]